MKDYGASRLELFNRDEKPLLLPLPPEPYEPVEQRLLKAQQNNHVYLSKSKKYFSVPHAHRIEIGGETIRKTKYTRITRCRYRNSSVELLLCSIV